MVVLDASAAVAMLLGPWPLAADLRDRTGRAGSVHAPHLLDLEVLQAIRRAARDGDPTGKYARAASAVPMMRVLRHSHTPLWRRIWSLRSNLSTYDAAYVALAETLDAPLVTLDRRLAGAPKLQVSVEVFGARSSG